MISLPLLDIHAPPVRVMALHALAFHSAVYAVCRWHRGVADRRQGARLAGRTAQPPNRLSFGSIQGCQHARG
jgi:hypothetical protein